jgi:hypothetical protein
VEFRETLEVAATPLEIECAGQGKLTSISETCTDPHFEREDPIVSISRILSSQRRIKFGQREWQEY